MKRFTLLLLAALPLVAACQYLPIDEILGKDDKEEQEERDRRRLERMRAEIEDIAQTACEDVEDCRFIGLGSKPCGGPWRYLVYSASSTDVERLRDKVTAYNRFEAQMNRRYGYISDCSLAAEPAVDCVEGHCVDLNRPVEPEPLPPVVEPLPLQVIDSFDEVEEGDPIDLFDARIEGDSLLVDVGHSGGCAEHGYALWTTQASTKSLPPQHAVRLTHDANGDLCEAYLRQTLKFTLGPIRQLHQGQESVIVVLDGFDGRLEYKLE